MKSSMKNASTRSKYDIFKLQVVLDTVTDVGNKMSRTAKIWLYYEDIQSFATRFCETWMLSTAVA